MRNTTTDLHLGHQASRGRMLLAFDYDERCLGLIVETFSSFAEMKGSTATLNLDTASILVDVDELDECHDYEAWLQDAVEFTANAWAEMEPIE